MVTHHKRQLKLPAAALLALVIPIYLMNLSVDALFDYKVKAFLKHEATAKAKSWMNSLIDRLPSIERMIRTGKAIGITEVNIDVVKLHDALSTSFARLSWFLIFGSALTFLVSASLVAWRSWQLRKKDRELIEIEQIDYFTGTLNRKTITAHLSKLFSWNKTTPNNCILFVDVDCFEQINDNHSHYAGDLVLKHVARTIRGSIRSERDFVGRFGGDDFIVVFTGATQSELLFIGKRIMQAMRVLFRNGNTAISLSVSIGAYLLRVCDDQRARLM